MIDEETAGLVRVTILALLRRSNAYFSKIFHIVLMMRSVCGGKKFFQTLLDYYILLHFEINVIFIHLLVHGPFLTKIKVDEGFDACNENVI